MNLPGEIKSIGLEARIVRANGDVEDLGLVAFAHQDPKVEEQVRREHPEWEGRGKITMGESA